jgi:phospholipase C
MATISDVETTVVVMLENRSFDNVLGHLSHPDFGGRADVDGLEDPATTTDYDNFYDSQVYKPFPTTDGPFLHDLPHSRQGTATQLDVVHGRATMAGFVTAYVNDTHSVVQKPPPLGFLKPKYVPMSGFLAEEYVVCDRWFASVPAGTQANRAVAYTGSTLIDDNDLRVIPCDDFIFDWLDRHHVRWRVYHSGLSLFLLFGRFQDALGPNFRSIRRLAQDVQNEPPDEAPQVVFIEPEYQDSPVHFGFTPNDCHAPLPMGPGEMFLHDVYSALTSNRERWAHTLLVVTYDEHGGFYDHVAPERITMSLPPGAQYTEPFQTTGLRVPALVASPLVARRGVCKATLDHTSILQLFAEKYAGGARNYADGVIERLDQGIASLSTVLSSAPARGDVPGAPQTSVVAKSLVHRGAHERPTENQRAFASAARACLAASRGPALDRFPELAMLPPGDD